MGTAARVETTPFGVLHVVRSPFRPAEAFSRDLGAVYAALGFPPEKRREAAVTRVPALQA